MTEIASPNDRRALLWVAGLGLMAIAGGAAVFVLAGSPAVAGGADIRRELRDRGRIAVVGGGALLNLSAEGAQLIDAQEVSGLSAALAGHDSAALASVLSRDAIAGLLVDGRDHGDAASILYSHLSPQAPIAQRLRAYAHVDALRGVYLSPGAALYERDRQLGLEPADSAALAHVARGLLAGALPPRLRSFPEPLRRSRNVEVMILLEEGGRPRLWRSARGGSIARALMTAAGVARQRWIGREQTMGPLDSALPGLTVKVVLLEEDGTIGDRSPTFLDRVITPEHGVALEVDGAWHYLLPDATRERGHGSALRAYRALLEENELAAATLERPDARLYRLVAREVAASPPSASGAGSGDGLDRLLDGIDDGP